jgi:hypothetical protein
VACAKEMPPLQRSCMGADAAQERRDRGEMIRAGCRGRDFCDHVCSGIAWPQTSRPRHRLRGVGEFWFLSWLAGCHTFAPFAKVCSSDRGGHTFAKRRRRCGTHGCWLCFGFDVKGVCLGARESARTWSQTVRET